MIEEIDKWVRDLTEDIYDSVKKDTDDFSSANVTVSKIQFTHTEFTASGEGEFVISLPGLGTLAVTVVGIPEE